MLILQVLHVEAHGLGFTLNPVEGVVCLTDWNMGRDGAAMAVDAVITPTHVFVILPVPHIHTVKAHNPFSVHQQVGALLIAGL